MREHLGGGAEEAGDEVHVLVVSLPLVRGERLDEAFVGGEGAVHECRMHPEHQLRVGGGIARAGREGAELLARSAVDTRMHGLHRCPGSFGLLAVAEGDQVERSQRADEAAPEVAVVAGVLDDPAGDKRMCHLEQHGRAAAEEWRHRRVSKAPHHALRAEIAIPGLQALQMRPWPRHCM